MSFAVTLSSVQSAPVTVTYRTIAVTASGVAGDYVIANLLPFTIAAGATSGQILITVNGDTDVEPSETFSVELSLPTVGTISRNLATGTIVNDDPAATVIPRLVNISTRGRVETGDNIMIGGFIIGGNAPKKVVITGRGPFLADFGVSGVLADPALRLFAGSTEIASNDNWQSAANAAEITASGFAPTKPAEAAIHTTVNPGVPYTVHLTGVSNATGVALVEVFEADRPETPLLNISTRGRVQTGDNVMIGGFIIQGTGSQQVLVTARGPALGQAPFNLAGVLADPTLELFQAGNAVPIATNDNWGDSADVAAIQATGNAPTSALESAIIKTLAPGAYTAIVKGKNSGIGIAIVEVFKK